MKTIDVKKATGSLAAYVTEARDEPLIIVSKGRPLAALMPVDGADLETVALSLNRKFMEFIERSRARHAREGGMSSEEMRRRLGLPAKKLPRTKTAVTDKKTRRAS
jgi:prevent-host-death family protein